MSAANCRPARSEQDPHRGQQLVDDPRPAHLVADVGRGAVVADQLQPFRTLAAMGLPLDTLLLDDAPVGIAAGTPPRRLRRLEAFLPGRLRGENHRHGQQAQEQADRQLEGGKGHAGRNVGGRNSEAAGRAERCHCGGRTGGVAKRPPAAGPTHRDVKRACIRICEEHPEQTWRFLSAESGPEGGSDGASLMEIKELCRFPTTHPPQRHAACFPKARSHPLSETQP